MADPKKGTGKKPKGSGRRLYTDENPKDTVRIKFATPTDARKTLARVQKIKKPLARKIQILTGGEQRAKVMGKTEVANIFKKDKISIRSTRKNYYGSIPRDTMKYRPKRDKTWRRVQDRTFLCPSGTIHILISMETSSKITQFKKDRSYSK